MAYTPVTAYVKTGDGGSVAYQIDGEGSVDLVVVAAAAMPLDLAWEEPGLARVRTRLCTFSRNVWVEQRGWGSSDRDADPARGADEDLTDEQLTAVANAVGSERFALLAFSILGPWAIRYAARHPERVSALILIESFACYIRDDECPWGFPMELINQIPEWTERTWGTGSLLDAIAPSRGGDERLRDWFARGERLGASPSYAGKRLRARYLQDARDRLSAVRVPTLVIHRRDDAWIRVQAGRYLAEHIDGAKYVELPGTDHEFFVGDSDVIIDEIEEFLTGNRTSAAEVVVSTILFTDIVDSTQHAAKLGHRTWSNLKSEHDARVRKALTRYQGREIKTMGDGFLATFDSAGRAMRCGTEVIADAQGIGLSVRAGVHTGEVEFRDNDVAGLAVTIGKRVCDLAAPGQILVTDTVRGATVGSNVELGEAGEHDLKGVPGTWRLFTVKL